ncbi:preprotein translocase, SecY subunit [Mycoplasma haemocanis str. Illinois]|uniref:Protein translocase subunit SecY n=1 Tax=Mycoplasma haemocanis (strain Illinois) TaxID=1111676 RepID=H6N8E7_MYCHN|nr:preprotein translocase subunit SecY [Mycoplasma haemocanis]AEW45919.1 preprotein translocase, SecY subunit [Mycoplasma haemocanis str. Illinois]
MVRGNRDTWVAIFSTLFILFIFQLGSHVTVPGITLVNFKNEGGLSQLLNLLGGGGLKKVSLFSVGISPYITAQIIIHMMSNDIVRHLAELRKGGERGRYKMELYTRLLAFPFAVMTSLGTITLVSAGNAVKFKNFSGQEVSGFWGLPIGERALLVILFVSGTYISLFLADIISKRGLGNGITILMMSGIASSLPDTFTQAYKYLSEDNTVIPEHKEFIAIFKFVIYLFFYFLILLLIVFINGSTRKIPIQQTGQGLIFDRKKLSYLPIKLMPAGITPVVFAGSLMVFPSALGELLKNKYPSVSPFVKAYLSLGSPLGLAIYFWLIIFFSFVYSHIQLNLEEMTRNFGKSGRFIPGIRSGQHTYNHLKSTVNRINCFGAPFLAFVAVLPNLMNMFTGMPGNMALGGTGIIILVSGSIQVLDSIKSNTIASRYKSKNLILGTQIKQNLDENLAEEKQFYLW